MVATPQISMPPREQLGTTEVNTVILHRGTPSLQDSVSQQLIQSPLRHDLKAAAQELLEFGDESAREPGTWVQPNVDE